MKDAVEHLHEVDHHLGAVRDALKDAMAVDATSPEFASILFGAEKHLHDARGTLVRAMIAGAEARRAARRAARLAKHTAQNRARGHRPAGEIPKPLHNSTGRFTSRKEPPPCRP